MKRLEASNTVLSELNKEIVKWYGLAISDQRQPWHRTNLVENCEASYLNEITKRVASFKSTTTRSQDAGPQEMDAQDGEEGDAQASTPAAKSASKNRANRRPRRTGMPRPTSSCGSCGSCASSGCRSSPTRRP